ncbi:MULTISPECIES: oleate hydratase [Clostridium]|uniref:Oleate hydratase n=1 Tax=Clostridium cibarium TaxID=2762247 RepID=A0ABR8PZ12_9CLOT|nr:MULTISPECIES: oleate hydratase [Clostridium]MBD7913398.1 oleate hydratase [Clostridium cibarium]
MNKKTNRKNILIALGAVASIAATAATINAKKIRDNKKLEELGKLRINYGDKQVYFIGGGLSSLAGASYLIRDCNFKGENIHIYEGLSVFGGSNDASGDEISGFLSRGGRMLNEETYENFWELFSSIPSLELEGKSVTEEILNFDHLHPTHAQGRLIDKHGVIQDVKSMGLNNADRLAVGKLIMTSEESLDEMTIEEWFDDTPHFFESNFWFMWQTTFAFQKWSSIFEFKRYMERMIREVSRIETLEGVTHTPYNQYESIIIPLKAYLDKNGVKFIKDTRVKDLEFKPGEDITVTAIHVENDKGESVIKLNSGDICIMTNGCMTDSTTIGDFSKAPDYNPRVPMSVDLWIKVARKKIGLGNPEPFFMNPDETNWESFTVTCKGNKLIKLIEKFTNNIPGSGGLITFKDSNWLMSIVIPAQPYFKNQPLETTVFWGYGLYTNKKGNYVEKSMRECTGEEILIELLHHLHFDNEINSVMETVVNVIPCLMPFVGAQFQPRKKSDRPKVVPKNSTNFAMIGQFVEVPEDIVFTEEYSVRSARMAIYNLFNIKHKEICKVTPYKRNPKILKNALKALYR